MKKCLQCGRKLAANRRKFCCNKHKDRYHNTHNPRGMFAHLAGRDNLDYRSIDSELHPFDSDALGQE